MPRPPQSADAGVTPVWAGPSVYLVKFFKTRGDMF